MQRFIEKSHLPLLIVPLVLFLPTIFTGKALVWGTVSTQFIPWWDLAWDTILQGQIPLWNPWVGMGAPLAANYQSAIFYPPYWILLGIYAVAGIKWMSWGVTLIVVFHLIWSGLGLAKLLKEIGLSDLSQIIGGLAYSLSGYLVARAGFLSINAAASWLPWILFLCVRLSRSKKYTVWELSAVFSLLFLAGHAQTAWYSVVLAGLWMIYWSFVESGFNKKLKFVWNSVSKFILAGLLGAGVSAIQLIPTFEYLLQSQRSGEYGYAEAMTYSFWPWRFLTFLVPNLFGNPGAGNYWGYGNYWEDAVYVGLLPVLIAAGTMIRAFTTKKSDAGKSTAENSRKFVIFLAGIIFISFLLALGDNTPVFPFLYKNVPTFGFFQGPTRFSLWAVMALSILSGIGIEKLTRPAGKRVYWTRLAAAGCVAVVGGALLGWKFLPDVKSTFFLPVGLAGVIGLISALLVLFQPPKDNGKRYRLWSTAVIMLVAGDLLIAGWGLNPSVKNTFYDIDKTGIQASRTFIASDLEYDLKFNKYFKFETFSPDSPWEDMHKDMVPNLPILQRAGMVNNFDPLVPGRFQNWIDAYNGLDDPARHQMTRLMGVGMIITQDEGKLQKEMIKPVNDVRINNVADIMEADQQILTEIIKSGSDLVGNMILASTPSAVNAQCGNHGSGDLAIRQRSPGYINIDANIDSSSWVIWSQSWYPGWIAIIDGEEKVQVERANYIFQAVCVPAGKHKLEIVYRPFSFTLGLITTIASCVVLFSGLTISRKRTTD